MVSEKKNDEYTINSSWENWRFCYKDRNRAETLKSTTKICRSELLLTLWNGLVQKTNTTSITFGDIIIRTTENLKKKFKFLSLYETVYLSCGIIHVASCMPRWMQEQF